MSGVIPERRSYCFGIVGQTHLKPKRDGVLSQRQIHKRLRTTLLVKAKSILLKRGSVRAFVFALPDHEIKYVATHELVLVNGSRRNFRTR